MENSFDRDSVKVHATVMNSKWKGGREGTEGNWKKKRSNEDAFDVRKIISVSVGGWRSRPTLTSVAGKWFLSSWGNKLIKPIKPSRN